ncbi:MAG TPA: glutathione S-transferase family protein [Candidatus Dormibacteraeota bacterium]|nr:glutathione S-transferase family protein [Candidatus Dormibacteraeota bacterium]
MKLYVFAIAPNPTRVRLYLSEKAAGGAVIELRQILVNLPAGEQRQPGHLARNPFGKVPVLEFDDGSHLIESLAIIEYLEECHPDPPMIGRTPLERARVREAERIAELGVLLPVARIIHATNSPLGLPPNPGVAESARAMLPDALRVLDDWMADGRPFVAGAAPSIADCTLAAAFQFARFGGVEIDAGHTNLMRWDAAYRARPAAQAVLVA